MVGDYFCDSSPIVVWSDLTLFGGAPCIYLCLLFIASIFEDKSLSLSCSLSLSLEHDLRFLQAKRYKIKSKNRLSQWLMLVSMMESCRRNNRRSHSLYWLAVFGHFVFAFLFVGVFNLLLLLLLLYCKWELWHLLLLLWIELTTVMKIIYHCSFIFV